MRVAIEGLKEEIPEDSAAKNRHDEQLDAACDIHSSVDRLSAVLETREGELKSAMKEQQQLVIALKPFVEDKVSSFESQLTFGEDNMGERERSATSWPSATLPAAYFATLLLSSVMSSIGRRLSLVTYRPILDVRTSTG